MDIPSSLPSSPGSTGKSNSLGQWLSTLSDQGTLTKAGTFAGVPGIFTHRGPFLTTAARSGRRRSRLPENRHILKQTPADIGECPARHQRRGPGAVNDRSNSGTIDPARPAGRKAQGTTEGGEKAKKKMTNNITRGRRGREADRLWCGEGLREFKTRAKRGRGEDQANTARIDGDDSGVVTVGRQRGCGARKPSSMAARSFGAGVCGGAAPRSRFGAGQHRSAQIHAHRQANQDPGARGFSDGGGGHQKHARNRLRRAPQKAPLTGGRRPPRPERRIAHFVPKFFTKGKHGST